MRNIFMLAFLSVIGSGFLAFSQHSNTEIDSLRVVVNNEEFTDSIRLEAQRMILDRSDKRMDSLRLVEEMAYAHLLFSIQRKKEAIHHADSIVAKYKGKVKIDQIYDLKEKIAFWVRDNGQGTASMKRLFDLLDIYEKQKRIERSAQLNRKIGVFFLKMDEHANAIYHLNKAAEQAKELKNDEILSNCYMSIGNVYKDLKDFEQAEFYYKTCIRIAESNDFQDVLAGVYNNIGSLSRMQGKGKVALDYYFKAVEMNKLSGNNRWLSYNYNNIGNYYLDHKQYQLALDYFLKSEELKQEINDAEGLVLTLLNISTTYEKLGDIPRAFEYHKSFYNMKDSLDGVRHRSETKALSAQFQAEQRESEIRSLNMKAELDEKKIAIQKDRIGFQKWINSLLITGIVLLVLLAALIWRNVITKKRINTQLEQKNALINEKNRQIIDSLKYASDLQQGILVPAQQVSKILPGARAVLRPKDIVSGDFYLIEEVQNGILWGTIDCTGHGVPGAMVSLVAYQAFQKMIFELKLTDPGELLSRLSIELPKMLQQTRRDGRTDGLDCSIVYLDHKYPDKLYFSGARQNCYIFRGEKGKDKEIIELKSHRNGIGEAQHLFETIECELLENDTVVLMSDGLPDQFGGLRDKKFGYQRFKSLMSSLDGNEGEQLEAIMRAWDTWKGDSEQVDDVCLFVYHHRKRS